MASRRSGKSGDEGVARLIRERREALGMTRRDLADRSGLSYPYISQLETAYRLPSAKAMHALARSLGLPASDLFEALPSDSEEAAAVDYEAAPQAPASRWITNPAYPEPKQPLPLPTSAEAARSAISALEVLPPENRLDALAKVQAAVLAGIVREQAVGPPSA